jgi:hypothetical protein
MLPIDIKHKRKLQRNKELVRSNIINRNKAIPENAWKNQP